MTCNECNCAKKGYFASKPDAFVCIGVKEPFVIPDIYAECTEYPERRDRKVVNENTELTYGIVKEYQDGTTLCYEALPDQFDGCFVLRASDGDALHMWMPTRVY